MPIAMIVSHSMLCPRCPNLLWKCGTVNFFCLLTCTFAAPPYFKSWIHPCSKTLNYALVHQSFTIKFKHLHLGPPAQESKKTLYQFQLFISAFHFSFSTLFFILFQLPLRRPSADLCQVSKPQKLLEEYQTLLLVRVGGVWARD